MSLEFMSQLLFLGFSVSGGIAVVCAVLLNAGSPDENTDSRNGENTARF